MSLIKIEGIKCDNPTCDYEDNTVVVEEYESYLNKPCPKCNSNLLTEADLKLVKMLIAIANNPIIKLIDKICGFFGANDKTIELDMNGSGKVKVKEK